MDIHTLNAVIANLEEKMVHNREMIEWTSKKNDKEALSMWCHANIECKENIEMVEKMLEEELNQRDQEVV